MADNQELLGDPAGPVGRQVAWGSGDIQQLPTAPPAWTAITEAAPTSAADASNDGGALKDEKYAILPPLPFTTRLRYALPAFSTTSLTILISLYVNDFYGMRSLFLSDVSSNHDQVHESSRCWSPCETVTVYQQQSSHSQSVIPSQLLVSYVQSVLGQALRFYRSSPPSPDRLMSSLIH